jgi:hypothetical protein
LGKVAAGASRLVGDLRNIVSRAALRVARDSLHDKVALFVGDVFEYLHTRGDAAVPGDIVSDVMASIDAAASQRSANEDYYGPESGKNNAGWPCARYRNGAESLRLEECSHA